MTYTLDVRAFTEKIRDRNLEQLCRENPDMRFEIDSQGKLIIMSPTGSLTGEKNSDLNYQVQSWNRQYKLGKVFDSSTGFKLSNGATRSPDVSWIAINRWNSLSDKQKRGFAPINPDFVIELMSPPPSVPPIRGDERGVTQQKMSEYLSCGVQLGWLINPDSQEVEIYRLGQDKEILHNPSNLSGETILPGLTVDLSDIF